MAKIQIITISYRDVEIGRVGYDENSKKSYFQYHAEFLKSGIYKNLFPFILKRTPSVQVFSNYNSDAFRGLPPMIADSLPDTFGNFIFREWLEATNQKSTSLTALEQLTYVGKRAMGAIEFQPAKELTASTTIDIEKIAEVLRKVLDLKLSTQEKGLSGVLLLNIFKIGTSAGGVRPKIIVSEHKESEILDPGDLYTSSDYNHWLVKLALEQDKPYVQEQLEFVYYKLATGLGIEMMPSKLIHSKHFATLRFDRQNGQKQHVLTASGLTGWNYKDPEPSSYENLFKLSHALHLPHRDLVQLFKRMVFNVVFANSDDHLKNFSFLYNDQIDGWNLAPAYDLNYPFNVLLNVSKVNRALSVNGKRDQIRREDLLELAVAYSIKGASGIIDANLNTTNDFKLLCDDVGLPSWVVDRIALQFNRFESKV